MESLPSMKGENLKMRVLLEQSHRGNHIKEIPCGRSQKKEKIIERNSMWEEFQWNLVQHWSAIEKGISCQSL